MRLIVRFDITQLIEEEFTEFGSDDWYIQLTDVPFLPQKGVVASFFWRGFVKNREIVKYLEKINQDIYIGEQTKMFYMSEESVVVYIDLIKERRTYSI